MVAKGSPGYEAQLAKRRDARRKASAGRIAALCRPVYLEALSKAAALDSLFHTRKSETARLAVEKAYDCLGADDYQGLKDIVTVLNQGIDIMLDYRAKAAELGQCGHSDR